MKSDKLRALAALSKMEKSSLVERMIKVVQNCDHVPLWIQNEIYYYNKATPYSGTGGTNGNAALMEDRNYHGGYVE